MKTFGFILLFLTNSAFAFPSSDADNLFNWAETEFPQYFSTISQQSQTIDEWYYRYYPNTNNYLGVNSR